MKSKSVLFCYAVSWLWLAILCALCGAAPWLLRRYMLWRALPQDVYRLLLAAFYLCSIPAFTALICLLRLLHSIRMLRMFSRENIRLLGIVSWCCVLVALITFAAGLRYFPLFFFTAAMLFVFLIVRVVAACFVAAEKLREENSLTI